MKFAVAKRCFVAALSVASVFFGQTFFAADLPESPLRYVSDEAGVLSETIRESLEELVLSYERETSHEIAVATIKRLPDGESIEDFANRLFRSWGVGKADANNGVLFILAIDDRKMRIEVGYGLEGDLTDIETKVIQDDFVRPYLQRGDYEGGIRTGVEEIQRAISEELVSEEGVDDTDAFLYEGFVKEDLLNAVMPFLVIFGAVGIRILGFYLGRSRSWWLGSVLGAAVGFVVARLFLPSFFGTLWPIPIVILALLGAFFDYIVSRDFSKHDTLWKYLERHSGSGRSGGGSSGGGSSSSGFGGGSSGGGGSSSSW